MAYIGNTQNNQNYVPAIDYFSGNGSTVSFTLSRPVASVAQVQAVISNVPQNPGDAYTINGNTITFTSAPPSGTNNIYVYYTSPNTQIVQPGQGTVYPASLSTGGPTWDTSGNLGLGVTPSAWYSTRKALQFGVGGVLEGSNNNYSFANFGANYYTNTSGNTTYIGNNYATLYAQTTGQHQWYTAPSGTAGNAISFTQAMTLDASGNLGIGTSSPSSQLHVASATAQIRASNAANTVYSYMLRDGFYSVGSEMYVYNASNNPISFHTNATERMRIDSSGNLLVGTTSQIYGEKLSVASGGSAANAAAFYFNTTDNRGAVAVRHAGATGSTSRQMINFHNSAGTVVGSISSNGTNTAYGTSSDYRLKENIQPMQNALATVAQLNPVTYTWKADGSDGQGFIAHELQAVVPDCVTGEKDAVDAEGNPVYQGIDTSFLVATLTKAIQELKAEVDATKAEVAALKGAA